MGESCTFCAYTVQYNRLPLKLCGNFENEPIAGIVCLCVCVTSEMWDGSGYLCMTLLVWVVYSGESYGLASERKLRGSKS